MGGIGQKQQTQTQPSISCLPGVAGGGETSVTHHCEQSLYKDADDGQFSQASAFFFQRSPASRSLYEKMAQIDKTCLCQHIIKAGQDLREMGGVYLSRSCTERAVQVW